MIKYDTECLFNHIQSWGNIYCDIYNIVFTAFNFHRFYNHILIFE